MHSISELSYIWGSTKGDPFCKRSHVGLEFVYDFPPMSADQQGKDHRESISRHYTADGAASAVGVAVRRCWHRQKATSKALSTVLVVLDCSGIFEI